MNNPHWFYTYLLPLLPTVLTIAGWFLVARRESGKQMADRKSKRIDAALLLVAKIEADALRYYRLPEEVEAKDLAVSIVFDLKRLAGYCRLIHVDLNELLMNFRISVSGGDFQSGNRQPLPDNARLLMEIKNNAFELQQKLDYFHDH
ncbi:MAG: hypothetical protein Q4D82_04605 [Neisseria sp.]|nr:hypothetical protein [Neisseria sp.]